MNLIFQATPTLLSVAIDRGIARHRWELSAEISIIIIGLGLIGAWSFRLREKCESLLTLSIFNFLVRGILEKSLSLGITLHKVSATGVSVSVGIEDTNKLSTCLPRVTSYTATAVFSLVNCCLIILEIDKLSAIISAASMVIFICIAFILFRFLRFREHDFRAQSTILTGKAGDIVLGLRILGGIGGQNIFAKNYIRQSQLVRKYNMKQGWWISLISAIANVGPMLTMLVMIYLAGKSVIAGTMPLGKFIILTSYMAILSWAVWAFIEVFYELIGILVSAERIINIWNISPEFTDPVLPAVLPAAGSSLYDPVHDITINAGESLAIISAHPHIADAICYALAYYAAESTCRWGGIPFKELSLSDIRSHIVLSDQDDYLFSASLKENILLGRSVSEQILTQIITASYCDEIIEFFDQGWDTHIFDDARNLSSGQRQRVRLARALAAQSEYLFLIDPTSAVDAQVERIIVHRILSFRRSMGQYAASTIFSTSSPTVAAQCDQVIFIDEEDTVHRGTHQTLLHKPQYKSVIQRHWSEQRSEIHERK